MQFSMVLLVVVRCPVAEIVRLHFCGAHVTAGEECRRRESRADAWRRTRSSCRRAERSTRRNIRGSRSSSRSSPASAPRSGRWRCFLQIFSARGKFSDFQPFVAGSDVAIYCTQVGWASVEKSIPDLVVELHCDWLNLTSDRKSYCLIGALHGSHFTRIGLSTAWLFGGLLCGC